MPGLRDTYAENTRQTLLDTARRLFAERDYGDIPAEELVRAAGLSRGALYHHFDGKRGLFEAVFTDVEQEAADRVRAVLADLADPFAAAESGAAAYLDICAEHAYRHIVLVQGPVALGWQRCLEIDHQLLGSVLDEVVRALLDTGQLRDHRPDLLAAAFYGSITSLALTVAAADDPHAARAAAAALVTDLIRGLRVS